MNNPQYQSPAAPRESRQCFKCNCEAVAPGGPCPRCGCPKFLTAGSIRARGGIAIATGIFLMVFIGAIAAVVGLMLYGEALKNPETAKKLSNEANVLFAAILLFGALMVFGFQAIISGMWMLAFGKRNRMTPWIMWTMLSIVLGLGVLIRWMT